MGKQPHYRRMTHPRPQHSNVTSTTQHQNHHRPETANHHNMDNTTNNNHHHHHDIASHMHNLNLFRFVPKSARSRALQIFMFLGAVTCFLLGILSEYSNLSSGILWGSGLSFFSVITVLVSYASDPSSRQHPNPLVFWRTIADSLFVLRLLMEQFVR